ncbi:Ras protein-specific guanine nucleotide-releasing factor [Branchiostoma belcheri]|nr:Ras protein-specific guanine nucleotide-releasing factor [Branchiostoma belcheri]
MAAVTNVSSSLRETTCASPHEYQKEQNSTITTSENESLAFKLTVESKQGPPAVYVLMAATTQEKAAWCSDISQRGPTAHAPTLYPVSSAKTVPRPLKVATASFNSTHAARLLEIEPKHGSQRFQHLLSRQCRHYCILNGYCLNGFGLGSGTVLDSLRVFKIFDLSQARSWIHCIDNIHYHGLLNSATEDVSSVLMPQNIRTDARLFNDDVDIRFSRTLNSCKVPQIRYATVERLLERLTDLRFLSIDFLNTFLYTYRVFTSGSVVLEALIRVYRAPETCLCQHNSTLEQSGGHLQADMGSPPIPEVHTATKRVRSHSTTTLPTILSEDRGDNGRSFESNEHIRRHPLRRSFRRTSSTGNVDEPGRGRSPSPAPRPPSPVPPNSPRLVHAGTELVLQNPTLEARTRFPGRKSPSPAGVNYRYGGV